MYIIKKWKYVRRENIQSVFKVRTDPKSNRISSMNILTWSQNVFIINHNINPKK